MKVLVAEDYPTSRIMLQCMLQKCGYEVIVAEDGQQAWNIMQQPDAPRLVLLDWGMPVLDGLQVTRLLREQAGASPLYIIMVTSMTEKEHIVAGLNAGANDYVTKPFDAEVLQARVAAGKRMVEMQSSLLKTQGALEHEASHDALTGILNRKAILGVLCRELSRAKREKTALSLGVCDIDRFKFINDTYGHLAGDDVLRGFVERMQGVLREYDSLGRWGGDEFLVIAPGCTIEQASSLHARLRAALSGQPIISGRIGIPVSMSIGLAMLDGDETEDDLVAKADEAMYSMKKQGCDEAAGLKPSVLKETPCTY